VPEKQEACVRCAPHLVQSGVKAILPPTRPTFVQRHDCWLHKESVSSLSNRPCQDTSAARRRAACPSATSTSGLRNRPTRSRAMAILPTPGDRHPHFPGQRGECIHSNRLPPDKMERGTDRPTLLPPSHIRVLALSRIAPSRLFHPLQTDILGASAFISRRTHARSLSAEGVIT